MEPLEIFTVETTEPSEAASYESILKDIISELAFSRTIGRIKVRIRPEDSLFMMVILLRRGLPPIKAGEISDTEFDREHAKVVITVRDEKTIPQFLDRLWEQFGRQNVIQPERNIIEVAADLETVDKFIAELIVDDPEKTIRGRLADMAIRATPEGFRIRYHSLDSGKFVFVASEDTMQQDWIDEANVMLKELEGDDS
ncbi:methanogenesis marker 17 protein [Methanococcoides alaskense]|jgi:putative methanogenesis marker protein 17|uniref:Methanogenesis marker protein 17 n=1 Tax=Methanococcoides alaskense TaxID=325778 RepID=A0AA90TZ05_9EURY|nr:methanogenesis marker 17 protein [Methanococcoides alaskense]MDA0524625.1 methanogenesis marker 17 protein [Methanococcoides alaskense]MDR6222313.1 putative methanogenesis marker protein 17 [Methanococcoides alaskense]